MNPEYTLFQDTQNGDFFIVTTDRVNRFCIPSQFKQYRSYKSAALALLEMKRVQTLRDTKLPYFLVEQAS